MLTFPRRTVLNCVVLLTILLPLASLSQVKIKEKVEIKPKAQTARSNALLTQSDRFFDPPLFVWDAGTNQPHLTLSSHLTVQGAVTFDAEVGCGQQAQMVVYLSAYRQDAFAWRGKQSSGSGCGAYDGQQPFVGDFSKGGFPDAELYLFDWEWADGQRQMSGGDGSITYSFTGTLRQGILSTSPPPVVVTGTATATGDFLPAARLSYWELHDNQTVLTCGQSIPITMTPVDGYGALYEPYGIPRSESIITVRVDDGGPYVFLRGGGQKGTEVTTTLVDGCRLFFDPARGGFTGETKDVLVTVTGGGQTGSFGVTLQCDRFDHFKVTASPPVLVQGMTSAVTVLAQDYNNQEVTFTPDEDFDVMLYLSSPDVIFGRWGPPPIGTFSVDGGDPQWPPVFVPYSVVRAGRVQYIPDPYVLGSLNCMTVVIEASADPNKHATTNVQLVKETRCATVTVSPATLAPGETASVTISRDNPADKVYVAITPMDGKSGTLVSSSGSGVELTGDLSSIQYVAPATIENSPITLSISAFAYTSCGTPGQALRSSAAIGSVKLSKSAALKSMKAGGSLSKEQRDVYLSLMPKKVAGQSSSKNFRVANTATLSKMLADDLCPPAAQVMVSRRNLPPVITSVTFDPPQRYFQLGSSVTVTATATDPDGDAVTLTYLPNRTFTLNNVGAVVVTTVATDSKGAMSPERKDTIFVVYVYIADIGPPRVEDGESTSFQVKWLPADLSPSSVRWTREPSNPSGGNQPDRDFVPPETNPSVVIPIAKWYADPDAECGAKQDADYKLTCGVTFGSDPIDATAKLTVEVPKIAARTYIHVGFTGEPAYIGVIDEAGEPAYGIARGTLVRSVVVDSVQVFLLPSSQFMSKMMAHENVHKNQYTTGVAQDFVSYEGLWERIRNLRAPTITALQSLYSVEFSRYLTIENERTRRQELQNRCEIAAYAVSDLIAPRYFYQRCDSTNFPLSEQQGNQ